MSPAFDRKAALRAYKERKPRPGVYAVRLMATGEQWIGTALDLDTAKNAVWHRLEEGRHLDRALQAVWKCHGAEAFTYETLEVITEEMAPTYLKDLLKARRAHWQARSADAPTAETCPEVLTPEG